MNTIWIGWDPREAAAFAVARESIKRHLTVPYPVRGVVLDELKERGLFYRPMVRRPAYPGGENAPCLLWDVISDAPCATEFSNSRFLVYHLAIELQKQRMFDPVGWALFMDCDMLVRGNLARLFDHVNPNKAVMCVQHQHVASGTTKMDGQVQTQYGRKNWSSVMLFNLVHPSNRKLTVEMINTVPGRDLHRFCWLEDDEIGALPPEWNWLAGEQPEPAGVKIVHHTLGSPCMPGYENAPYAAEWRDTLNLWARGS